jgi:hypothetical protein
MVNSLAQTNNKNMTTQWFNVSNIFTPAPIAALVNGIHAGAKAPMIPVAEQISYGTVIHYSLDRNVR